MEWFLGALWPEGLSKGLYQLLDVESPSLIDEATSGLVTCEAERKAEICYQFANRVHDTDCITPVILKGLLIALCGSVNVSEARHEPHLRWTVRQAHDIIHLSHQIQLEKGVTQGTVDWFVRAIWPNSASKAVTGLHSALSVSSVDESLVSPAIRGIFVGRVLEATEINDYILDWLYRALFRTASERSPCVDGKGPFSDDEDIPDTIRFVLWKRHS